MNCKSHWKTNWAHLREPIRFRETNGLVLSESLLEKLERRFPVFPDCCLWFSPDWVEQREGGGSDRCGKSEGRSRKVKFVYQAMQWTCLGIYWLQTAVVCVCVFLVVGGERHVFKVHVNGVKKGVYRLWNCYDLLPSCHQSEHFIFFFFPNAATLIFLW